MNSLFQNIASKYGVLNNEQSTLLNNLCNRAEFVSDLNTSEYFKFISKFLITNNTMLEDDVFDMITECGGVELSKWDLVKIILNLEEINESLNNLIEKIQKKDDQIRRVKNNSIFKRNKNRLNIPQQSQLYTLITANNQPIQQLQLVQEPQLLNQPVLLHQQISQNPNNFSNHQNTKKSQSKNRGPCVSSESSSTNGNDQNNILDDLDESHFSIDTNIIK